MTLEITVVARDLAELNEGFLELVADGLESGLSGAVAARLRRLDSTSRRRLGAAPFALFGFGFEDEAAWAGLLSPGVRDLEPGYRSCPPEVERFTLLALMALRSCVRTAPRSVAAWIGLPNDTRKRLATQEISSLGLVAPLAAPRLRGRLAHRDVFWLRYIDAAASNDEPQLKVLAAQGRQWTIRRSLGLSQTLQPARGFRRQ